MQPAFDSPIEVILVQHILNSPEMMRAGIRVHTQVPIGRYRVDIVLANYYNVPLCIIECDGKYYHSSVFQKRNDAIRSQHIKQWTGLNTIRFTGSQINRNAPKCVQDIIMYLQYGQRPRRRW